MNRSATNRYALSQDRYTTEASLRQATAIVLATFEKATKGGTSISVDGYTDSIGSVDYNLGLSRRRAGSVQQALSAALGGSGATRIVTHGHDEADPVAPNTQDGHDNPAGRAQNRRVVISFSRG